MKKFVVIYHAPQSAVDEMQKVHSDPDAMKDVMGAWKAWMEKSAEHLVDIGTPLGNAHRMSLDNHGPSESTVVGYSIIQADSWEQVNELIQEHPHLDMPAACEIEVLESMPMPEMN